MITRSDVEKRLKEAPFTPFRIHLTNGKMHEVRHPEMAKTMARSVLIGVEPRNLPEDLGWQDYHLISMLHIVQIDPVGDGPRPVASSDSPAAVS